MSAGREADQECLLGPVHGHDLLQGLAPWPTLEAHQHEPSDLQA